MAIDLVKVRAKIEIGGVTAGTPPLGFDNHILSFNVDKNRGQISTFSASLKIRRSEISGGLINNAEIKIYAGTRSSYGDNVIFTGLVRTATISPNRDDPEFVVLNISGNDKLINLQGKKFTRRCRSSKGVWVSIDSVSRPGLRSGKLGFEPAEKSVDMWGGDVYSKDALVSTRPPSESTQAERAPEQHNEREVNLEHSFADPEIPSGT
jgi:hypothetical protein